MRGYESIRQGSSQDIADVHDAREDGSISADVGTITGQHGREGSTNSRQRRKVAAVSVAVLSLLGILAGFSGNRIRKSKQDALATDLSGKHQHAGESLSVYESSLYSGARLDQEFPSPAGLKTECAKSSDDDDDDMAACPGKGWGTVVVDSDKKMQKMIGFGGAFTDAATINFYKLPEAVQEEILDAYFGPNGIEYSIGRVPMGSCDFSIEQYSFDEVPGDYNLTHFDDGVERDSVQRIPMILDAVKRRKDLKIFTSPWSPPAWMKEPQDGKQSMIKSAHPEGLLPDPRVHAAWALFFSRFISAYKKQGVNMWGLTIQNESENLGPWEACVWTPNSQASFIRDHLGPIIRQDHPDVKIMAFDHNRDHLIAWTEEMMRDEETAQYVDGMAYHWYFASGERLMDGSVGWEAVNRSHTILTDFDEDKFIISSESCNCPNVDHSLAGGWKRAEHTAHDVIAGVNAYSTGWVDWNLVLSYEGGPNHVGNLCDTPVACNKNHTDVTYQPMFYYLGHISKFAQPGSRRLKSHITGNYHEGGKGPSTTVAGYEATVYGCEGSVRQSWEITPSGKVALTDYYGAQFDWYTPMCLSKEVVGASHTVTLVVCDSDDVGIYVHDSDTGHLVLQTDSSGDEKVGTELDKSSDAEKSESEVPAAAELCLDVLAGSIEDGAVLTLALCDEGGSADSQKWEFTAVKGGAGEGSVVSALTGQCMTAGWPFLTGAAFEMADDSKDKYGKDFAVVLLNEAEETVEFDLSFPSEGFTARASIGPRSIQTILA